MVQISEAKKARLEQYESELWQAALKGALSGSLIALILGTFLNYRYNHGLYRRFFKVPYKAWYFISWNIVGITFTTDNKKVKLSKQAAVDDEIRRTMYLQRED